MSTTHLTQLRDQIDQTFNEEEVRSLCSDIGVDYDNLGGRGKAANVRELLAHCQRHSLLPELQTALEAERSHINWRNLISPLLPRSSSPLPLYHIPFHQNPNFTGREELMQQLQSLIANQKSKIVIAGLGGMGKTQLVLEYCYHHDEYGLIYWLNADDVPAVNEGLAGLAYELGLMRREAGDPEAAVQAALRWLAQTEERWLLVYDNADQIEPPALLPYLPKMGNGVCLITSRNANWQAVTGAEGLLRLDVFTETEAVGFLRERLGRGEESDEEDAERELVAELGYFPLALEHAAAYMAAYGRGVTDYLALYQRQRQALWQRAEIRQDYQKTITTTWELAFEQARQTSGAMALLNLCCFLDGEGIPLALLTDYSDNLPEELAACVADELDLGDAIVALRRYSLLQRERRVGGTPVSPSGGT